MRQTQPIRLSWQTVMLIVVGIAIVIIAAFLLAQADSFQKHSAVTPNNFPIIDLEATIAGGELSTVYLPNNVSPTPTITASPVLATAAIEQPNLLTPEMEAKPQCTVPHGWGPYTVKPTDSLPKLARAHGTTVYQLMKANCLAYPALNPGYELYLPGSPPAVPNPGTGSAGQTTGSIQSATPSWPISTPTPSGAR